MTLRQWAAAALIVLAATNVASAESDNNAQRDPGRQQAVEEKRDKLYEDRVTSHLNGLRGGAVIFDLHMNSCPGAEVQVARETRDGKLARADITTSRWFAGRQETYFVHITPLAPGVYEVLGVLCTDGQNRRTYNGPFAKFEIKLGEIVNVGALKLDYKSTDILFGTSGKIGKSIESLTQAALIDLGKRYPATFAKAVVRPMQLIGPAEVEMKKRPRSLLTGQECPPGVALC